MLNVSDIQPIEVVCSQLVVRDVMFEDKIGDYEDRMSNCHSGLLLPSTMDQAMVKGTEVGRFRPGNCPGGLYQGSLQPSVSLYESFRSFVFRRFPGFQDKAPPKRRSTIGWENDSFPLRFQRPGPPSLSAPLPGSFSKARSVPKKGPSDASPPGSARQWLHRGSPDGTRSAPTRDDGEGKDAPEALPSAGTVSYAISPELTPPTLQGLPFPKEGPPTSPFRRPPASP